MPDLRARGALGAMLLCGCYGGTATAAADTDPGPPAATEAGDTQDTQDADASGGTTGSPWQGTCDPVAHFESVVWPNVLAPQCLTCHRSEGSAAASRFVLDPDDLETSYEAASWAASTRVDGRALLDVKPTGLVEHAGGVRFSENSYPHGVLLDFITHVAGEDCEDIDPPEPVGPFYDGVTFIDPVSLVRKVTFGLAGRLPSESEVQLVRDEGLDGVDEVLDALLDEEGFYRRVKEAFGDIFLTENYSLGSEPEYVLAYEHFPSRGWYQQDTEQLNAPYSRGMRYEPVELVAHILRENRPFHEIVTADYMMVSPFSARGYDLHGGFDMFASVQDIFSDAQDPEEFVEARLPAVRSSGGLQQTSDTGFYPHAGVLSTFHYTYVYESSDSNRNRRRARMFYKHFLGVDIMALAPSVADAAVVTAQYDNPTLQAPECVACHETLDPVAGLFAAYGDTGAIHIPEVDWHTDMFPPGFEGSSLPAGDRWRALQWLAERVADDPRFPIAMAEHAWYVLTQTPVAAAPLDTEHPLYPARVRAYDEQRRIVGEAADAMQAAGGSFKEAIRSLVLSEAYRAETLSGVVDPTRAAELELTGVHTLLTPEQLDRKYELLLGYDIHGENVLSRGSDILYGGLDYRSVVDRLSVPNAVMGAKMRKWANQLGCEHIPEVLLGDLQTPIDLFPYVGAENTDTAAIVNNIVHLHWLLLGRDDAPDSAEVGTTLELFESVRAAGLASIDADPNEADLPYACRVDGNNGDPEFVVRSWQAVFTYLLRHPEFLTQ
ncbi:MAG: hypothetical protein KUG77_13005 [Nannocystaceae bacterium]|nr:hypothetical protein [Nannocystaceae bacterium]